MDDFESTNEDERRLAAQLGEHLESASQVGGSLAELASPNALLENSEHFELSADARRRGRAEVDDWINQPSRPETKKGRVRYQWFYWLSVPAIAVAALTIGYSFTSPSLTEQRAETAAASANSAARNVERSFIKPEVGFKKLSPRFHAGETPRALLRAQAAVLTERKPGKAQQEARDEFDRQMRAYRGQLIASLEVAGR